MGRPSFNPKECIGLLNNVKTSFQISNRPFTKGMILEALKRCGLPTTHHFWKAFRDSGIIQEVSNNKFMFSSKNPIYWERLQTVKEEYQKLSRTPNVPAVIEVEPEIVPIPNSPEAMEQFAVDLLKEKGYKLFKPAGVLYAEL